MFESWIRTAVPAGIAAGLTWLAVHFGVVLDEGTSAGLAIAVTGLVVAVYYAAARLVERRWPTAGRMLLALGLTKAQPTYERPTRGM